MKFAVRITTKRLNGYILGEIGTGTRERNTTEYSNRRQSVPWDVRQVLTPSEWIHKFHCTYYGDAMADTISRWFKGFTYKFYSNFLSTRQYIHLYSPMNGRKNAKQYKNNAVTLTILKYSATVIEHIWRY